MDVWPDDDITDFTGKQGVGNNCAFGGKPNASRRILKLKLVIYIFTWTGL